MTEEQEKKSGFGWSIVMLAVLVTWPGIAAVDALVAWREKKPEFLKLLGLTILGVLALFALILSSLFDWPVNFVITIMGGVLYMASAILFNRLEGRLRELERARRG